MGAEGRLSQRLLPTPERPFRTSGSRPRSLSLLFGGELMSARDPYQTLTTGLPIATVS